MKTSIDITPRLSAHRSAPGGNRRTGFTLTELLVVILTTALLAVTAFTITRQVMAKARQSGCVSAMRQVGIATAAYIQDNNDRMPGPIQAKRTASELHQQELQDTFQPTCALPGTGRENRTHRTAGFLGLSRVPSAFSRMEREWPRQARG